MSYIAVVTGILGSIYILICIADRLELFYFTDSKGEQIPFLKHFIYLVSGWLLLAAVNVGIKATEVLAYPLTGTLSVTYKTIMVTMILVTTFYAIGFTYSVLERMGGFTK